MAEKNIKTRIIHKHDTEENWNKATNFIPKQGEIIVYDIDSSHSYERIKIGDGTTNVISLPYVNETVVDAELSATSENPVQNKVIKGELDKKIEEPSGNGLVRKFMSGMYGAMGVNTTMPDSPTNGSVPTTKLLKDYVEDNTSNPLKLSDANLQKYGLLAQSYTPAGSTPGTVGTTTYSVVTRDTSTLDDTITGTTKVPSSYVVGEYVKESIANKADISNPLSLSDTDKTKSLVLIQHNYDSDTSTGKYVGRSIDTNNLSESGLSAYNIPTSKAVAQYVQNSVSNKVDKVEGKGLSTNDYTNEDKAEIAKIANKADINNPLSLAEAYRTRNGIVIHDYTSDTGEEKYVLNAKDEVILDYSIYGKSKIPSSYVVGNYVKESISAEQSRADNTFSNALKGSKSGAAFLIDDVSPITCEMGVKISSDTVEDLTAVKVRKQGKNLIPCPYQQLTFGTSTDNGVDFTVYRDGSILINGTATKSTTKRLYTNATGLLGLKSGITISISKNASDDTQQRNVYFVCNYYDSTGTMKQGPIATTTPSGTKTITDAWKGLGIYINIPSGKTLNNLLIKPQLEIGATATEYEPYITPTEYIPTADGTVNGIISLYPNTTLTTDTESVIINCKYNRDINKAFAALEAALAALATNNN